MKELQNIKIKNFQSFITSMSTGKFACLGLNLSYINHNTFNTLLHVELKEGKETEFLIKQMMN
jgi:hypothetical protein